MKYFLLSSIFVLVHAVRLFSQDCSMKLLGHVVDSDTKEKLVNATVTLIEPGQTIVTNNNGDFVFDQLCPGNYTVRITHISCDTVLRKIDLFKTQHIDFNLPHAVNTLGTVSVTGLRSLQHTGIKKDLSARELEETRGLSLAQALSKLNGVTMLQTGSTIAKPVIHGLHSNRILTINNGVRQEGQQWGNEHAPEIDPFIADNLTVIQGVDELRYGSDAIGGVILVNPRALRYMPGYYGELNTGYFTNNGQYVISGMFEQQLKKISALSYRLQGTLKKGGNMAAPGYRLNNTGLQEENFSLTAGWKKDTYSIEAFYSQFHTRVGIFSGSHIGNLTDLQHAIAASNPNTVFLGENTYSIRRPYQDVLHRLFKLKSGIKAGNGRVNVQFAAQYNQRAEYDIVRNSNIKGPQLNLDILSLSEDLSWEHPAIKNLRGTVGISSVQQDNNAGGTFLIPNYSSLSVGGYWLERWTRHNWELQGGIRFDYKDINTVRYPYNNSPQTHAFDFSTLASSLNGIYKFNQHTKANLGITLASRAPYVNELLSDGVHHGTATYEKGDYNLQTERSVNIAAGFSYTNTAKTFNANITLYSNHINNFIYQQPKPAEPVLTIRGAFPKLVYQQTNARLRGADIEAGYFLTKHIQVTSKASLLRAYNRNLNDWLILMPSDRLSNELAYHFNNEGNLKDSYVSVEFASVFKQTRVPSDANGKQDYKTPPDGYNLLNIQASTIIMAGSVPLTLGITATNVLNKSYREYLNSFRYFTDDMGRNISIRLKIPMGNLK